MFAERRVRRVTQAPSVYADRKGRPDRLARLARPDLKDHPDRKGQQALMAQQDLRDRKGHPGLQGLPVESRTSRPGSTRRPDSQPTCCPVAAPSS